ncbi:hypothetical protein HC928_02795 [bacterium]|nr:hypothetical protein [bacterium]
MTYQAQIPQPGSLISVSQNDLLENFQAVGNAFPVNHVDFNVADVGKHKFVQFPNQAAAPVTGVSEVALYSKDVSGNSRVFLRQQNSGSEVQLTNRNPSGTTSGETFFSGRITF